VRCALEVRVGLHAEPSRPGRGHSGCLDRVGAWATMSEPHEPQWIAWARRLQAVAQTGLAYTTDPFDIERYEAVRSLAAEMISRCSGLDRGEVRSMIARDWGHATPKIDVRGVVIRDKTILLVKERSDGRWTLPGGWADIGESPSEAVAREIREESGYEACATRLVAVLDRNRHSHPPHPAYIYKLFFLCDLTGGKPETSVETERVGFFPQTELPPLSLARVTPQQIVRAFAHHENPGLAVDFD
jgi:ADP-ribose pyrophosphatase YjhB (NUDIX family)